MCCVGKFGQFRATSESRVRDRETAMSRTIKAIDTGSIHRITSGQVVIDLQAAVKELLENSFDAGATSVEVRFKEYGVSSIEVVDNGSGIAEDSYDLIGESPIFTSSSFLSHIHSTETSHV